MSRRVIVEADGGSRGNPGPAGYGAVVRDATAGDVLREVASGIGVASNNVAEYRGLIAGLEAALDVGADDVEVRMDSLLVVNQMSNVWKVKHEAMRPLASQAASLVRRFSSVRFVHVPREQNRHADRLANQAMDDAARGLEWSPRTEESIAASTGASPPQPQLTTRNTLYGWSAPVGSPAVTWLLRHGETALSVDKRFSGRGDAALTDRGTAQAKAAATRLAGAGITAVVTSPLRRARQTAEIVAGECGVDLISDADLAETDFGVWEGLTFGEVRERWPAEMSAWLASPEVAPPGGESFATTFVRVAKARERFVSSYAGKTVVVVAHVTPIKALLRAALEASPQMLFRVHLDPASLSVVDWYDGDAAVVRLVNDVSHLGSDLTTSRR